MEVQAELGVVEKADVISVALPQLEFRPRDFVAVASDVARRNVNTATVFDCTRSQAVSAVASTSFAAYQNDSVVRLGCRNTSPLLIAGVAVAPLPLLCPACLAVLRLALYRIFFGESSCGLASRPSMRLWGSVLASC